MTKYLTNEQMGIGQKEYLTDEQTSGPAEQAGFSETAADVGKSLVAGSLRGTAGIADLPMDLAGLAVKGGEWLTGGEAPEWLDRSIENSQGFFRKGMGDLTGGFSEREAETTAGRYAGTIGEFLTPAGGAGLLKKGLTIGQKALKAGTNAVTGAVVPGVASEALGQAFEGTGYETPARLAGAVLGGVGGNRLENVARGIISPGGAGKATSLADARLLRDQKVPVSAGQATGSSRVQGIEAKNPARQEFASVSPESSQLKGLTTAALRNAGLTDDIVARVAARPDLRGADPTIASRPMIEELSAANSVKFDNALNGIPVQLDRKLLTDVRDAFEIFKPPPPGSGFTRRTPPLAMQRLYIELRAAAMGGPPIPAARLQEIRSSLGKNLTPDIDPDLREAASQLRRSLDEAIERSVQSIGQPERMGQLLDARKEYHALLAIKDAVAKSEFGVNGIITPDALYAGVRSAKGEGMPISDLADAAKRTIKPLPPAPREAFGRLMPALDLGALSTAAFAGPQIAAMAVGNPMLAAILAGGAGSAAAIDLARRIASGASSKYADKKMVQRYLENQLVSPTSGIDDVTAGFRGAAYGAPSILGERVERKAGGRVGIDHERLADQLVGAAERAKKGISRGTEQLLDMPDDHVAHALELANRSI